MNQAKLQIASNSFFNFVGNAFRVVISFGMSIILSRWLGPENYGITSLLYGYAVFLHYFFTFGLDHGLTFFISSDNTEESQRHHLVKLKWGIEISLALSIVILTLIFLLIYLLLTGTKYEVLIIPAIILCGQMELGALNCIMSGFLRGIKKFKPAIIFEQILYPLSLFLGMFIFISLYNFGVLGFSLGHSLGNLIGLIFLIFSIYKYGKRLTKQPTIQTQLPNFTKKSLCLYSLPIGCMSALEPLFSWSTIIILGFVVTMTDVGHISIALRVAFFLTFFTTALNPIFSPYLTELWISKKHTEFKDIYQTVNGWGTSWAMCFLFLIIVSGKQILAIFGKDFIPAYPALVAVSIGLFFEGCLGSARMSLVMTGKNKINFYIYLIFIPINVLAIYAGSKINSIIGATLGFSGSMILLSITRSVIFYNYFNILPYNKKQIFFLFKSFVLLILLCLGLESLVLDDTTKFVVSFIIFISALFLNYMKDYNFIIQVLLKKSQK